MTAITQAATPPPRLPLMVQLQDFKLSLDFLRIAVEEELKVGNPFGKEGEHRVRLHHPDGGQLIGRKLVTRIGALLSRPGCAFVKALIWDFGRGAVAKPHFDRAPLDITMSIPVFLDGVDMWPLKVRQPSGDVLEWPSRPGTACILDGRLRRHWRDAFTGERAVVLLLHWRAPAVLRPRILNADACVQSSVSHGNRPEIELPILERCADLARLAVPRSGTPEMSVCDRRLRHLPVGAGRACRLLVLLDGELTVTFDALEPMVLRPGDGAVTFDAPEPVVLRPGDGIAFPVWEQCRLDWTAPNGRGQALLGYGPTSRRRRPRNGNGEDGASDRPYVRNRAAGRMSEA